MKNKRGKTKRGYNINTKLMTLPAKYKVGFLRELDKRTESYKLLNAAYQEIVDDVGGAEQLSHVQRCLIERFCFAECLIRRLEYKMTKRSKRFPEQLASFEKILNSIIRLSSSLGLKRKKKQVVSLSSYVKDAE